MEPIARAHDPREVELFLYASVERADAVTQRFRELGGARFRDVRGWSDARVADRIREDAIDILVELGGHTGDSRLGVVAHRPAPIQVSYLGYPGTTGLSAVDYRLTDAIADPPGATESLHREELARLPHGAWCFGDVSRLPR